MANIAMVHIVMAYIVMACIIMAHVDVAYVLMAYMVIVAHRSYPRPRHVNSRICVLDMCVDISLDTCADMRACASACKPVR